MISKGIRLNLNYINALNQENINHIKTLGTSFHISTIVEAIVLVILAVTSYRIWKKITTVINIRHPDVNQQNQNFQDENL